MEVAIYEFSDTGKGITEVSGRSNELCTDDF